MSRACPPNSTPYMIEAGDTFYRLAQRFNTTIDLLISLNPGVNPNTLQIGQMICVPYEKRVPPCVGGRYYDIRPGDTLYGIAGRYGITLGALLRANPGIDPVRLQIGQTICLPGVTPGGQCPEGAGAYIIRAGDTFYRIARRYNVDLDRLLAVNPGVDPDNLTIGETICIPD